MASKNSVKHYVEGGYYHLYNRGVEKRNIFQDEQDYAAFLSYLKTYLSPKNEDKLKEKLATSTSYKEKAQLLKLLRMNNFNDDICLLCFCLMPNHFHLLVKQKSLLGIDNFMNSMLTRYVMYFNRKYKRVGSLFQDVYKAVLVETDEQLLYLTAYMHRNPLVLGSQGDPLRSQPSSYPIYLGEVENEWVQPEEVLAQFSKVNPHLSYESFVERTEGFGHIDKFLIAED